MKEDMLLQIFNEDTTGKNHANGQRVLNNDLISSLDIDSDENYIYINGNVISENLFNEYKTLIKLDTEVLGVTSTNCGCLDYEKNGYKKRNYCCKHLVATFYKAAPELTEHPLLRKDGEEGYDYAVNKSNVLGMLLSDENSKDEIKLEVFISKDKWNGYITAEFKIGLRTTSSSELYILKDIDQFLSACNNNFPVEYSKNFTFSLKKQRMNTKDKRLISFLETLKELESKNKHTRNNDTKYIEGKYINIPKFLTRDFFDVIKTHRVFLYEGIFSRPVETEILYDNPPIDFDLKNIKDSYILKSPGGMPVCFGNKNDVFLYGTTIYLADYDFCYKIAPYLQLLSQAMVITIPQVEEEDVLRKLIPELNILSQRVVLSKTIKDKIVSENVKFNFYFDKFGKDISLTVKVKYGSHEFGIFEDYREKVIYRDSKKEQEILKLLRNLRFEEIEDRFYLLSEDDYIFRFFKSDIDKLQQIGEVFYSESFKGIKVIGTKGLKGEIRAGKYNYFEMDFKLGDIPQNETSSILRAFRDNYKYYKLKTGEYLDLEEIELRQFLKLLDAVANKGVEDNRIEVLKNKSIFLENYIEENGIRYIKGKSELEEITAKLKNFERLEIKEPAILNGSLREYQKIGLNWFRTIDHLGFGGILGDEMGLGKTLQTISFLLTDKGSKTIIITPTSLVYNWVNEFEKFAPSISVVVINGPREDREELIKSASEHEVIITTYNLLKRDLEAYKTMEFDYCIIDEAQYIKNPGSQNALSVKEIKARTRFALTGTPIENSLMELWSIFDYIMPGYLYDEKRFSVRYYKRLNEEPEVVEELNKLIKPFILRRRKKDVIKELPEKIEKKLMVPLEEEQIKVYSTYAKHVVEAIEKRVKEDEFKKSKIEILSYLTRLRQICLDPSIVMENYIGGSGKIEALIEILEQSLEEGHRVLVFSQFTSVLKNIGIRMRNEGITYSYLDGSISSEERISLVNRFNQGENSVFLISLKAGGTGLNLTSADVVIHFDPWWNPAVEEQATDRAHRIGQKNVVEVIKLIAKGTIEEKVVLLQEEKKKLISELMGEELSNGESLSSFNEEELLSLFEIHS